MSDQKLTQDMIKALAEALDVRLNVVYETRLEHVHPTQSKQDGAQYKRIGGEWFKIVDDVPCVTWTRK